jgi:hypothetical protein
MAPPMIVYITRPEADEITSELALQRYHDPSTIDTLPF